MYYFILTMQSIALIISFSIISIILFRKPFRGQISFLLFIIGAVIQTFGYEMEIISKSMDSALISLKVQQYGLTFINLLFLFFLYTYCSERFGKGFVLGLYVYNLVVLFLVFTCDYHHLYFTSIDFDSTGIYPHLVVTHGILYYVVLVCNNIINIGLLFHLYLHYRSLTSSMKKMDRYFIRACIFPALAGFLYILGVFHEYNPLSIAFAFSGIFILVSIYRQKLYDIIHTARDNVIETMEESLIVIDQDYRLLDHNPAADQLFPEFLQARRNANIQEISPLLFTLVKEETIDVIERNQKFYRGQITKIQNNQSVVGYIVLIHDITENRKNMNNLVHLREQAENANKAKSVFLANMSHEIRTPLNAILGLTDVLLNQTIAIQERNTILSIKNAGNTLLQMINNILDYTKIESGKLTIISQEYKLTAIIHDVIAIININLAHKPIMLQVEVQQDLPKYFIGDELRLRQILINIMSNAVKFTEQGTIRLSCTALEPVEETMEDITLIFTISDTGKGIKEENQQRIFESFEQVTDLEKSTMEGAGLGLSICDRILSYLGGKITLESEVDVGSTFTIQIPQKISHQKHSTNIIKPLTVPIESIHEDIVKLNYSVLVVDDNNVNLQVAKGLLGIYGLNIYTATSGKEALDLIEHNLYNLIFLDYRMPEMNGIETLQAIRALNYDYCKTVPIIVLTATDVSSEWSTFLSSGFSDYIIKPMSLERLSTILNKWLATTNNPTMKVYTDTKDARCEFFKSFAEVYNIDWIYGLSNCNSQWKSYFKILEIFCQDGLPQTKDLSKSVKEMDYALYSIQIHTIKASLITIGAKALAELALSLETASKDGNVDYIKKSHPVFIQKFFILCRALDGFLTANTNNLDSFLSD